MVVIRTRACWQQFSIAGVLVALLSCSSGSTLPEAVEDNEPGAISGELTVYIADFDDGTSETRFMLRNAEGIERKLVFDREPDLEPGAKIHVWGDEANDAINVVKYKIAGRQD